MVSPRTLATLFRLARLVSAWRRREEGVDLADEATRARFLAHLDQALRDLDGLEPGWLERTPLWRSSIERKGKR